MQARLSWSAVPEWGSRRCRFDWGELEGRREVPALLCISSVTLSKVICLNLIPPLMNGKSS